VNAEGVTVVLGKLEREENRPFVAERNQASVESCVEMGGKKETIADIQSFSVSLARH
jgi:hypothetical protein